MYFISFLLEQENWWSLLRLCRLLFLQRLTWSIFVALLTALYIKNDHDSQTYHHNYECFNESASIPHKSWWRTRSSWILIVPIIAVIMIETIAIIVGYLIFVWKIPVSVVKVRRFVIVIKFRVCLLRYWIPIFIFLSHWLRTNIIFAISNALFN